MKNTKKKSFLLLAAVVALLVVTISGTVAYLVTETTPLVNTFTPTDVSVEVQDEVENHIKKDVSIKNTGSIPSFLRVAVVANWYDGDGNIVAPWSDYSNLGIDGDEWTLKDGYYYYNGAVDVDASVKLFDSYQEPVAPITGAHLEMDIIAQAIQAEGMGISVTDAVSAFDHAASGN